MIASPKFQDVEKARQWLNENCHRAELKHTLMRSLEYYHAVERAGLDSYNTCGDDLYDFLTDITTSTARSRFFVEPTL